MAANAISVHRPFTEVIDFINLRVGGRDNFIALGHRRFDRGVTFEAPRHSLMTALTIRDLR